MTITTERLRRLSSADYINSEAGQIAAELLAVRTAPRVNHLRALEKIDELAALSIPAGADRLAYAIGAIRYWIISELGEQSLCAQQCARERKSDAPLATELLQHTHTGETA